MSPATMALIGATSASPEAQARALRNDALLSLAMTGSAVGVLILHSRGRTQDAFGLAMITTIVAGIASAARLYAASEAARAAQ